MYFCVQKIHTAILLKELSKPIIFASCENIVYNHFRSSPEVITDGMYSTASDAWALGVLIWEIFTLIDKHNDYENDCEISLLPYHQLSSKDQVLTSI